MADKKKRKSWNDLTPEQKLRIREIQDEQEDNGVEEDEAEVKVETKKGRKIIVIEGDDDEIAEMLTTLGISDDEESENEDPDKTKTNKETSDSDDEEFDIPDDDENSDSKREPGPPPAHRYFRGRKRD